MRILITGACGFIGRKLAEALENRGNLVCKHTNQDGNLVQPGVLGQYEDIECVYHLAAKSFVPDSWKRPADYLQNNIMSTINVLEFCRKKKAKLVFVSTYLYGQPQYLPVDERHPCACISPYHLSKKVGEDICKFYSENYGVDVSIVRPFNVYGKGQKEDYLLSKLYLQLKDMEKKQVEVYDLQPKRDYIYVYDLVEMLIMLKDKISGLEIYNLGSGTSYSVKEVIDIMQEEMGTDKRILEGGTVRQNEVPDCTADIHKFQERIGKIRLHTLKEGIHEWHLSDQFVREIEE